MSAFEVTPSALSHDLGGRTKTRPLASSLGVSTLLLTMGATVTSAHAQDITAGSGSGIITQTGQSLNADVSDMPRIKISTPNGLVLDYDPALGSYPTELTVTAAITGLEPFQSWSASLNEQGQSGVADINGGASFIVDVDISPSLRPPEVPFGWWFVDTEWVFRPLTATLYAGSPTQVVDYDRVILYDARDQSGFEFHKPTEASIVGMASELTASGVEKLGPAVSDLLPYPTEEAFQEELTRQAAMASSGLEDVRRDEGCVSLTSDDDEWTDTDAYTAAYHTAVAQYEAYKHLEDIRDTSTDPFVVNAAFVAMQAMCVRDQPKRTDFQICVDGVEAKLDDVFAEFEDAALALETDHLSSQVRLAPVNSDVTASLYGVFIQWEPTPGVCASRPKAVLDDDDLALDFVDDWRTCPLLERNAEYATGTAGMHVEPDIDYAEWLEVTTSSPIEFTLHDTSSAALTNTCQEDWISRPTHDALAQLDEEIAKVLSKAWNVGDEHNAHAEMTEQVLSEFELGDVELTDHELDAFLASIPYDPSLQFQWTTNATPKVGNQPDTWFLPPRDDFPFADDVNSRGDRIDPYGYTFDLSFTVSAGHLNQVLRAQWESYDGVVLAERESQWLVLRPTFAPLTVMTRDLSIDDAEGQMRLMYQVAQFIVELHDSRVPDGRSTMLARFAVDFDQRDLDVGFGPSSTDFLEITGDRVGQGYGLGWFPLDINIPNCTDNPFNVTAVSCMDILTRQVAIVAEEPLEALLWDLLAEVPGPKSFGEIPIGVKEDQRWWRDGQNVTLYGNFEQVD